jgi:hypothetical protein
LNSYGFAAVPRAAFVLTAKISEREDAGIMYMIFIVYEMRLFRL